MAACVSKAVCHVFFVFLRAFFGRVYQNVKLGTSLHQVSLNTYVNHKPSLFVFSICTIAQSSHERVAVFYIGRYMYIKTYLRNHRPLTNIYNVIKNISYKCQERVEVNKVTKLNARVHSLRI